MKLTSIAFLPFLLVSTVPSGALDLDGDGMSDVWQRVHNIATGDTASDIDGDGQSNAREAEAGTDPRDSNDYFRVFDFSVSPAVDSVSLSWRSVEERYYGIEKSTDLSAWGLAGGATGQSGLFSTATLGFGSPANDPFTNRWPASTTTTQTTGSNIGATSETGEPINPSVAGGKTVWWSWSSGTSGPVTITTVGSGYDTTLAVYSGTELSNLILLGANDDTSGLQSSVTFTAQAGVAYSIQVDGYRGRTGSIVLNHPISSGVLPPPTITPGPPRMFFRVRGYPEYDYDNDGDTLLNWEERLLGTDPYDYDGDSDNDGMGDAFEFFYRFDPLSPADARQDADGDLLTNAMEALIGSDPRFSDPDTDSDGLPDPLEVYLGLSAALQDTDGNGISDALEDYDRDGLGNLAELQAGTRPDYFDTDGDLLSDGWEVKWGLNPLAFNSLHDDSDGDGLDTLGEYTHGTNPNAADTDGDGIGDKAEVDAGSDPLDPLSKPFDPYDHVGPDISGSNCGLIGDLGVYVPTDPPEPVEGRFGDHSGSRSERWQLNFNSKKVVNEDFGQVEEFDLSLGKKDIFELSIEHVATNGPSDNPWYPNYDYFLEITATPGFILCDVDEIQGEFWIEEQNLPDNYWVDKRAFLIPTMSSGWSLGYTGGDAVGPRYRKVALNGRPLPDEKPEQEEETDSHEEETYVDAFDLSLHHDTSYVYVPLAASDLVLEANASVRETSWSDRGGLRPHEELTSPFGAAWSSNLCAYIEVVETFGQATDDPITVNVVDEGGRSQRFGTNDLDTFFPWPSSRVDKKTYLNRLEKENGDLVLTKKYGNELTYSPCDAWFMYSTDRISGSDAVRKHTYWRLSQVKDRYGNRVSYTYGSNATLIPQKIEAVGRTNQWILIDADCRRINSITDARGETVTFTYANNAVGGNGVVDFNGNQVSFPNSVLSSVQYPDGTSTAYGYEVVADFEDVADSEKDVWHYHCNVESITDKVGNTHQISYAFDRSKKYFSGNGGQSIFAVDIDGLPEDVQACAEEKLEEMNAEGDPGDPGSYTLMYGMPRQVASVSLPDGAGSATFAKSGETRFGPVFQATAATAVTDVLGRVTSYNFGNVVGEEVDLDSTFNNGTSSVSSEWMIYYTSMTVNHSGLGSETFAYDLPSGLCLGSMTDLSGNTTTWQFGDSLGAPALALKGGENIMTSWADPTSKTDALGRSETYQYGNFRIMTQTNDVNGTVSNTNVDALGRRTGMTVFDASGNKLREESYSYSPTMPAFKTGQRVIASASASGQAWEQDLVTQYIPDSLGRLWKEIADPGGLSLTTEHAYDLNNNKISTTDPRGNITRFAYDKLNRLTIVTFPAAGTLAGEAITTKQIWYDENGNKAAEIDEESNYTIHHYDGLNRRITTIRDMDGAGLPTKNANGLVTAANKGSATGDDLVTRMEYDSVGNLIRMTDPRGTVTRTFFDSNRRPIHVFGGLTAAEASGSLAACAATAAASTEKTHTESSYDLAANSGSTAFDSSGFKPTEIVRHGAVLTATGTADLHTTAVYDKLYRPTSASTEYESGQFSTTSNTYGTITAGKEARQNTVTDDRGKITYTLMDGLMRPTSVTDAFGTALASTSQTFYSSTGLVWKSIDPLNRTSETEYDAAGRPIIAWMPDPITGLVNRSTPNEPTLGSPRTQTEYDANSNVTASINPLGQRFESEFDARNRAILARQPSVTKTEIIAGVPQQTTLQNPITTTAYDGVGNAISATDARGFISRSFYDKAYRVTSSLSNPVTGNPSTDPQNPAANDIQTQMSYDPNGNVIELIDANGNATRNSYDLLNRLAKTATNPADGQPNAPPAAPKATDIVVSNQYDDSGNLVKVTDGEGRTTGFRWDGMSRKTLTIWDEASPVEKTETATFDAIVQLARTDAKGQLTTYQHDPLHRLSDILYTGAAPDNRHYDYDLAGNLLEVSYPNETAARKILRGSASQYDNLNRLTSETSAGATHTHTYDAVGNRLTTQYGATGRTLTNTYDSLNRLLTLTENATATTSYGYDLGGNVTLKTLPNGSASLCTFDALSRRLTETTRASGGAIISAFDYSLPLATYPSGYDNVGNVLKIAETYGHANVNNRTVTNLYDKTYRLTSETAVEAGGPTITTAYGYDKNNNRTSKVVTGGSNPGTWVFATGSTTDGYNSNQIGSVTNGGTVTTLDYDPNGNITAKKVNGTTTQSYAWDPENRLIGVTDTTLGTFAYSYDHRTRRVGRDEHIGSVGFQPAFSEISFAAGLSVQEYTTGNSLPTMEYIRGSDYGGGIGGVLYTIRSGARSYNAYNSRGDVVSKTDDANTITWQAAYQAFGTRTQEQGTTLDRQKANTKDEDAWGALNEGMRYRLLGLDIFMSRDPMGFVDGPNDYTYVRQNPWTKFDPLGLATSFSTDGQDSSSSTHIEEPPIRNLEGTTVPSARDMMAMASSETAEYSPPPINTSQDSSLRIYASSEASPSELNAMADSGEYGEKDTKMFRDFSQSNSDAAHNWKITAGTANGVAFITQPETLAIKGFAAMGLMIKGMSYADDVVRAARGGGKAPIIVGENMKRIQQYADEVGGHAYRPWKNDPFNFDLGMKRNQRWIKDQMRNGREVIDIGPDFQRRAATGRNSPFYEMERRNLDGYDNHRKVFERNGQTGGVSGLDN